MRPSFFYRVRTQTHARAAIAHDLANGLKPGNLANTHRQEYVSDGASAPCRRMYRCRPLAWPVPCEPTFALNRSASVIQDVKVPAPEAVFTLLKRRQERAASGPNGFSLSRVPVAASFDSSNANRGSLGRVLPPALARSFPNSLPCGTARALCTPMDEANGLDAAAFREIALSKRRRAQKNGVASKYWVGVLNE